MMIHFTDFQLGFTFALVLFSITLMLILMRRTNSILKSIKISAAMILFTVITLCWGFMSGSIVKSKNEAILPILNLPGSGIFEKPEAEKRIEQHKVLNKDSLNLTLSERVAHVYGINEFPKVKSMTYTFNVKFNGKEFHRTWKWNPKTEKITYWGKDSTGKEIKFSYSRKEKMDEKTKKIDAAFINDNYWLLFPFHLVWDDHVDIKDVGMKDFPIGKGKGNCVMVKYQGDYGYTPGDEFELFLNKDYTIHQWIYMHGGSSKNPRPATWEGDKKFGKIMISTAHYGPNKKFKLWFSNVKVEY